MFATSTYRDAAAVNSAMLRVYNNMLTAVIISMLTAAGVASSPALLSFFFTGFMQYVTIFLPLVAILAFAFAQENFNKTQLQLFLMAFAALMGLSISAFFAVFTLGSVVSAFFGASILFVTMSGYGYFTKRSLESVGQFMFIGLIAICIAGIVNIFIGSTVMQMVISALAIVIFLGLTAYDTQQIREMVSVDSDTGREEVLGALTLYMDFINLFINLLQIIGVKRD